MDIVRQLPEDLVFQEIVPRLDYTSWARGSAVSRTWRRLFRQAHPLGEDIPWICLCDEQFNLFAVPPPFTSTSPLRLTNLGAATTGGALGAYRHYLLVTATSSARDRKVTAAYNTITGNPSIFAGNPFPPCPCCLWVLSSSPNRPNCVAALGCTYEGKIKVFRPGDPEYEAWSLPLDKSLFRDLIFHKGELYYVSRHREIKAVDVYSRRHRLVVPERHYTRFSASIYYRIYYFLVESCGELLLVTRYNLVKPGRFCPIFTVHRVDQEQGKLVQVHDLGDQMLFVRFGCSRSISYGHWPRASQFFSPNCIYFFNLSGHLEEVCFYLGRFSLKHASTKIASFHRDPLPTSFCPAWFTHRSID